MTPADLKSAGEALYGKWGWQTRLAEALGVDGSTVRRWLSGVVPVTGPAAAAIKCFLREHDRTLRQKKSRNSGVASARSPSVV
jgi:DNA-binding transcriptional regulator YdaS (Cro superfamily)